MENSPVPVSFNGKMTSKDIADIMGKRHDHVMRDIKSLILQAAINAPSFGEVGYKDAKGETRPMYELDFNATMTLITGYNPKLRAAIIKRWRELETGTVISSFNIPTSLSGALRLAADQAERIEHLEIQAEVDRPRIEFATSIEKTTSLVEVGELAKIISKNNGFIIGRNTLFLFLREEKVLMSYLHSKNLPFQRYMDLGWFEVIEVIYENANSNGPRAGVVTRVTGKGQIGITKLVLDKFKA